MVALAVSEGKEIEPETVKDAECQTTELDSIRKIDYLKTSIGSLGNSINLRIISHRAPTWRKPNLHNVG